MILLLILCYTIPLDSPLMDDIDYLQTRGLIDIPTLKPYELNWLIPQLHDLLVYDEGLQATDRKIISSFQPLLIKSRKLSSMIHVGGDYHNQPEIYGANFDFRFGGDINKYIGYAQSLRFRRASEIDSFGPRPWRNIQAYLYEGLVICETGVIDCQIGRRPLAIGPDSDNSLLLSSGREGFDGFIVQIPGRFFEFHNTFNVLDARGNAYISVHRIGLRFLNFFKLGFSESILYSRRLELLYLNPFLPYYLAQWGIDVNDNIMWLFDGQIALFNSVLYGEVLVDDYRFETEPYPHKIAYKVGLNTIIANNFLTKLKYTMVDKWVYTHKISQNVYVNDNNYPLGYPGGNDIDEISLKVKYYNQYGIFPSLQIMRVRKGEGSIFVPYEDEEGDWTPPFPSGVVEHNTTVLLECDISFRHRIHLQFGIGRQFWSNRGHIAGQDENETLLHAALWAVL